MREDFPIGVFDSGIGGLTVAAAIREQLPSERILYFGDTERCPYGDRHPRIVTEYSREVLDYLYGLGVKLLVVACNTATAVALPKLIHRYSVPVIGVIQPGARAAASVTDSKRIGVIGTAVTVASGAYERAIHARMPGADVISVACPAFVPMVEQGHWDGQDVEQTVRESLSPVVAHAVDTLILGCTHYPLLQPVIRRVMGPSVRIISSAEETAREVRALLSAANRLADIPSGPIRHHYMTSGAVDTMRTALAHWFADPAATVDVVHLSEPTGIKARA